MGESTVTSLPALVYNGATRGWLSRAAPVVPAGPAEDLPTELMSRRHHLETLRTASPVVLPSLLMCDFGNLQREIEQLQEAGVKGLHLDVMDGAFVPNFTYGLTVVEAVRKLTSLTVDVHLMMQRPDKYLQQFRDAGADLLTFHVEAVDDPRPVLEKLHQLDVGAGLAINPSTPFATVEKVLDLCDLLLVMSVPAGFGGQPFHDVALERLRLARQLGGERLLLEVDGGVNEKTISRCAAAGAQLFVVGSAIFQKPDSARPPGYSAVVRRLTDLATARSEVP
jgi:ribulose-phosphate 3-epimerase